MRSLTKKRITLYYSALIGAWIETRMERDKSLLALSTGGIGLLFTLLTTVGAGSKRVIVLYGLCFFLFLVSIVCAIIIFGWNAAFIQCLLRKEPPKTRRLNVLDNALFGSFLAGLFLTVLLGIVTGLNKISGGNQHMNDEIKTSQQQVDGQKSLSGLQKLSPNSTQSSGQSNAGANQGQSQSAPQQANSSGSQSSGSQSGDSSKK